MNRDIILITGASSDIGLAVIARLAEDPGKPLILAHCNSGAARVERLQEALNAGDSIVALPCDFRDDTKTADLASTIADRFGVPSRVVHLPALNLAYERFTKFCWERFEADMNVQVRSAVTLLRRFLPEMARMPSARIVFLLSSVTRGVPPKFLSMYGIVKYAQLGLMRSLASEYGDTGITVNAVSPGMVETRFLQEIPDIARQMSAAASPKKRNATPDDVVRAVEFLLSPAAGYLNGVEIPVTGGAVY